MVLSWLLISLITALAYLPYESVASRVYILALTQGVPIDDELLAGLESDIAGASDLELGRLDHEAVGVSGAWAIWPFLKRLSTFDADWFVLVEPSTRINVTKLASVLQPLKSQENYFLGYELRDIQPTIIHHFAGFDTTPLGYPDFGAGTIFSRGLLTRLLQNATKPPAINFTIDPKYELAKIVFDLTGVRLIGHPQLCLRKSDDCAVRFVPPEYPRSDGTSTGNSACSAGITNADVFFGIKTFSAYHKTRVLFVKRTWAKEAHFVEFFSDVADHYVPTVDLGIPNTQRGHCAKTFTILRHALAHKELSGVSWFVIADDDTLLSVSRLYRLLNCLPKTSRIILGERYGYGFNWDGEFGYDYPTGGAGMVFSRSAASQLVSQCSCPQADSPDDMMIGMCARSLGIPILHSAAFHQARRRDYAPAYVGRQPAISFHKFEDIDPYAEYATHLHESDPFLEDWRHSQGGIQHPVLHSEL